MRRFDGSEWVPYLVRSGSGAARSWPRWNVVRRTQHYMSPNGTGVGSLADPWGPGQVFTNPQPADIQAGDTVWMRGGNYGNVSIYDSYLTGDATDRVVLRNYPGERATIDGRLDIRGEYADYWGLEFTNTSTLRNEQTDGVAYTTQWADGGQRWDNVVLWNGKNRLIHCVIHDGGQGVAYFSSAEDSELYGNLVYYTGFVKADGTDGGHNIYTQNNDAQYQKRMADNIIGLGHRYGIHGYGESAAHFNYLIEGNHVFSCGRMSVGGGTAPAMIVANSQGIDDVVAQDNVFFGTDEAGEHNTVQLGFEISSNFSLQFLRNVVVGLSQTLGFQPHTWQDNLHVTNGKIGNFFGTSRSVPLGTWSGNTYHKIGGSESGFSLTSAHDNILDDLTFDEWQAAPYSKDADAVYSGAYPASPVVRVRHSEHETGRSHVAVYNPQDDSTVDIDLSGGSLQIGDDYEVHVPWEMWGTPIASGTYGGASVTVPTTAVALPEPVGGWQAGIAPANPMPRFCSFVVRKVES